MPLPAHVLAVVLAACTVAAAPTRGRHAFETVGLYVWRDSPSQHAFWRACGIDTLQFCDTHWTLRADLLDAYYKQFAADIDSAKRGGFRVYVILFSNISQWTGPAEREPTGTGVLFDPRDPRALDERLARIARAVRALRRADGFTFIAGDPGGSVGASFGPLTAADWMAMARLVRGIVRHEAPRARFNVNTWAIAYWQYSRLGCGSSEWWVRESELSHTILAEHGLIGPDCGVETPGHGYYRAMALRLLAGDGIAPDLCPTAEELAGLRKRGTKRLWAWPYFLLDEADDGDVGPDGRRVPGTQIETRYIHRLVGQMRAVGMNGVIGNWSYDGHLAKALNTYAFGRFCRDADATPERAIDEYARCVAGNDTWPALAQVLRFLENRSNWQRKLPDRSRLPDLACTLGSATEALDALRTVTPNPRPAFALAEPPSDYLARLAGRLDTLVAKP